jgi:predicted RNase H-like HicB family nuclease
MIKHTDELKEGPLVFMVEWSNADSCYVARSLDLEGVATHADTLGDALRNLAEASELHLQVMESEE